MVAVRPTAAIPFGIIVIAGVMLALLPLRADMALVSWVIIATVTFWITELLPVPAVSIGAAAILWVSGVIGAPTLLTVAGDPVLMLLLGSLVIAQALSTSGLAKRAAIVLLRTRIATRTLPSLLFCLGLITSGISLFVSNTAVTAMMMPVGMTIIDSLKLRGKREAIGLLLMLSWGSSVAVGMLIGSPPNLIAQRALVENGALDLGFLRWMIVGLPVHIIMLLVCWLLLRILYMPRHSTPLALPAELQSGLQIRTNLSNTEWVCGLIFGTIVLLWFLPDTLLMLAGAQHPWTLHAASWCTPSGVALAGAFLLVIIPTSLRSLREARPVLSLRQALSIDWNTMFLFGGGLLLGQVAFQTGLADLLGRAALAQTGAESQLAVTALLVALAIVLSELTSNTAAAALLVPLAVALTRSTGLSPVPGTLGVALGASLGFMMPISTPPNSIVYSSGLVPMREMVRSGIYLDTIGFLVVVGTLWAVLPLVGWW